MQVHKLVVARYYHNRRVLSTIMDMNATSTTATGGETIYIWDEKHYLANTYDPAESRHSRRIDDLNSALDALSGNMTTAADGVEVEDEESGEGEAE